MFLHLSVILFTGGGSATPPSGQTCDLNSSVRARVSSSRTSFFTPPNLKSEVSTPKICVLTASPSTARCQHYWYIFQGKVYLLGGCTCKHILGVDTSDLRFGGVQRFGHLRLKVRRCKKTCANTELFRIHGQAPPGRHPPVQCMLGYGQQAGSTHPTGMQSCWHDFLLVLFTSFNSAIHKAASSLVTGHALQNRKMSMGNCCTERSPEAVLYSGRQSSSFVNSAVRRSKEYNRRITVTVIPTMSPRVFGVKIHWGPCKILNLYSYDSYICTFSATRVNSD